MSETSFEKDFGFKLNTADAKTLVDAQRKMFGHMLDGMHRIARLAAEHPNDEGFQKGYEAYERLTEYTRKMMLATSIPASSFAQTLPSEKDAYMSCLLSVRAARLMLPTV